MSGFDFSERRFVVTGASSGIGRQVAEDLLRAGAQVLLIGRRQDRLAEVAETFSGRGVCAPLDVTDFSALAEALKGFRGQGPIDGSVHAAGVNQFTPLRAFSWEVAERILRTSLHAGVELVRILASRQMAAKLSSHVQIASVAAGEGRAGLTAYTAAKSAMLGAVRSMALELAREGARVNAVSPGWVETDMTVPMAQCYPGGIGQVAAEHPLGLGAPRDVSGAVLFLLSDQARWVTGSNLVVDGGYSA